MLPRTDSGAISSILGCRHTKFPKASLPGVVEGGSPATALKHECDQIMWAASCVSNRYRYFEVRASELLTSVGESQGR
jgi:hypothetical protein